MWRGLVHERTDDLVAARVLDGTPLVLPSWSGYTAGPERTPNARSVSRYHPSVEG